MRWRVCHIPRSYRNAKPNQVKVLSIVTVSMHYFTLLPKIHGDFGPPNGTNDRINRKLESRDGPAEILSPQPVSIPSGVPPPPLSITYPPVLCEKDCVRLRQVAHPNHIIFFIPRAIRSGSAWITNRNTPIVGMIGYWVLMPSLKGE
jgi:hypothetical protein